MCIQRSRSEKGKWKCKEFFVCEREEKLRNIEPNEINSNCEWAEKGMPIPKQFGPIFGVVLAQDRPMLAESVRKHLRK